MLSTRVDCPSHPSRFQVLVEKLILLTDGRNDDTRSIHDCLCDLNNLDYRHIHVFNHDKVRLSVRRLCVVATAAEMVLVPDFCKFLARLMTMPNDPVRLDEHTLMCCERWILDMFPSTSPVALDALLVALRSILINERIGDVDRCLKLLLGDNRLLSLYFNPCNGEMWIRTRYHAITCLEAILLNCHGRGNFPVKESSSTIRRIVLSILSICCCSLSSCSNEAEGELYRTKVSTLCSCLRVLRILTTDKLLPYSVDLIGEIMGVVRAFLFYGIPNYPLLKPQSLRPAVMNLPEPVRALPRCKNLKDRSRAKSKRQPGRKSVDSIVESRSDPDPEHGGIGGGGGSLCSPSDSDMSDAEFGDDSVLMDSRVRLETVCLLRALVERSPSRDVFGFWPQIVATGSRNDATVLARSILKEPVSEVKRRALNVLRELLIAAKPFLMHADAVDDGRTSFITFFGTVSLMIEELHFTLTLVLSGSETNVPVLTQALKSADALIRGTPYARLKTGLAARLMRNCRPYLFHKDPTVRVAALSAFEAIASCDPMIPEIFEILARRSTVSLEPDHRLLLPGLSSMSVGDDDATTDEGEREMDAEDLRNEGLVVIGNECDKRSFLETNDLSFLVRLCLENVTDQMMNTPVRLQSLKLIGRLAFGAPSLIFSRLDVVVPILIGALQDADSETQIALHACRALEIMASCFLTTDCSDSFWTEEKGNHASIFWNFVLDPVTRLAQHPRTMIREAACDCLGSIDSTVFAQLPRQKAVLIITVLFGAVRDTESAVRAAGLRSLGMLVALPALEEETGFFMDLADVVCLAADDANLGVRVKGAWALANLCDRLYLGNKDREEAEPIPFEILLPKIYRVSVKGSKDNDKVKCNAVRALGGILCLCTPDKCILKDTSLGLEALINSATLGNDMKVRWNACRALGLVLSNDPDDILPPSWRDQAFPALCNLICDSPNFKVRTNAAWALYSCTSYGKYIVHLWKSLILAFENTRHVPSYVEYPHRDALIRQLCLTLSRVAGCTELSDLHNLWAEISKHVDDVSGYMKHFQETVVPEKMGDIIRARARLERFAKDAASMEEQGIARSLASIFERNHRYDHLDSTIF